MLGPAGTAGVRGTGPRFAGTANTSSDLPSGAHCKELPPTAGPPRPPPAPPRPPPSTSFRCRFGTLCVRPVAASPIHTSIPAAVEFVNANRVPSGLQGPSFNFAFAGNATLISVPSGILRKSRFDWNVALWRPFVAGLMRTPANRSIGADNSAMGGERAEENNAELPSRLHLRSPL